MDKYELHPEHNENNDHKIQYYKYKTGRNQNIHLQNSYARTLSQETSTGMEGRLCHQ